MPCTGFPAATAGGHPGQGRPSGITIFKLPGTPNRLRVPLQMRESPLHRGRGTGGEMLTDWKLERYRRQIALFGEEAQERLAGGADLIVDADSFGVRCIFNGAVSGFDGQATTIIPRSAPRPGSSAPAVSRQTGSYGTDGPPR